MEYTMTKPTTSGSPQPRIPDAEGARSIIRKLLADEQPRSRNRARIQGLIDGNPPYDRAKLRRMGQENRSNTNFKEAKGLCKGRKASYFDLLVGVKNLAKISFKRHIMGNSTAEAHAEIRQFYKLEDVISEEFNRLLREWSGFVYHTSKFEQEMVYHGVGFAYFKDPVDWRFHSAGLNDILIPSDTPSDVSQFEIVVIKNKYSLSFLYDLIRDADAIKTSESVGWNIEVVKKLIANHTFNKDRGSGTWEITPEDIQQRLKDSSFTKSFTDTEPISCDFIYWKELSGKISMGIIPDFRLLEDNDAKKWLFMATDTYDSVENLMTVFYYELGNGNHHSVRGVGYDIFNHIDLTNKLFNNMMDGAALASSIVLQSTGGGYSRSNNIKSVRVGPITVIPQGFQAVQSNFRPDFNSMVSVVKTVDAILDNNVGISRPDVTGAGTKGAPTSARGETIKVQKETRLERTEILMHYVSLDRLYKEILRRVLNPEYGEYDLGYGSAKAFRDACEIRGVPKELLSFDNLDIKATRAIGAGSPMMKDLQSQALLQLTPMVGEQGKQAILRTRVEALAGIENSDLIMSDFDAMHLPGNDDSIAQIETNQMITGLPALAALGQEHKGHIEIHMSGLDVVLKKLSDGTSSYTDASVFVAFLIEHIDKHISLMSGNPMYENDVAKFKAMLPKLMQYQVEWQRLAQREAQEAKNAEAQQAQMEAKDVEIEKAKIEADRDAQVAILKENHNHQVRVAKAENTIRLAEEKQKASLSLQKQVAASKINKE